jgi:hypothetical protein
MTLNETALHPFSMVDGLNHAENARKLETPAVVCFCEKMPAGSMAPVCTSLQSADCLTLELGMSVGLEHTHCSPPGMREPPLNNWPSTHVEFVIEKPTLRTGEQDGRIGEWAEPNCKQGSPQSLPHARKQCLSVEDTAPSVCQNQSISTCTSCCHPNDQQVSLNGLAISPVVVCDGEPKLWVVVDFFGFRSVPH